jgi:hypothetical protein
MRKYLWNVSRIGTATAGCQNQKLGTNREGAKSLEPGEPRNSVGPGGCLLSAFGTLKTPSFALGIQCFQQFRGICFSLEG